MGVKLKDDAQLVGGFVRERGEGRGVRVSTPKSDELSHPVVGGAMSSAEAGKAAKGRRTKLAVMGLSATILDAGDPRYAACVRLANSFRKARTKELYEAHGYVSTGVSALLAASAMALASSRFCYEFASSAEGGLRPDILSKAAKLSDSARQNELSAWELCARESVIRKRNDANSVTAPWLVGVSGGEHRKPGRPRKALAAQAAEEPSDRGGEDS